MASREKPQFPLGSMVRGKLLSVHVLSGKRRKWPVYPARFKQAVKYNPSVQKRLTDHQQVCGLPLFLLPKFIAKGSLELLMRHNSKKKLTFLEKYCFK